jgi:excisionase family DNA binding protein
VNEYDRSRRHEPEGRLGDPPPHVARPVYRQLFDRESLADYLRLSTDTVDRLVKAGKLPCVRIGHQVRFTLDDVERFIDSNRRLGSATG